MKKTWIVPILAAATLIGAPIRQAHAHAGGHGGPEWPAISTVEDLLHQVETNESNLREQADALKQAIAELATTPMPSSIRDPLKVKLFLDDVCQAAATMPDPATATPKALTAAIADLHDSLFMLMEAAGMDHPHHHADHGPHDGMVADLQSANGETVGQIELKLHGDIGDLEAWLTNPDHRPLDLPLTSVLQVTFSSLDGRTVPLRPRNQDRNEDEDNRSNVRNGMTNYFVFPGTTGADASWLSGDEFEANVSVIVPGESDELRSQPFILRPHGGEDHHHH